VNNSSIVSKILTFDVSIVYFSMIVSFGNSDTEKIWNGERVKNLPNEIQQAGRRKLRMLNNSVSMPDLEYLLPTGWKN
jgi:hypothetical protein